MKVFAGQTVTGGEIIVRQRGTVFKPGEGVGKGKDDTMFAKAPGIRRVQDRPPRARDLGRPGLASDAPPANRRLAVSAVGNDHVSRTATARRSGP